LSSTIVVTLSDCEPPLGQLVFLVDVNCQAGVTPPCQQSIVPARSLQFTMDVADIGSACPNASVIANVIFTGVLTACQDAANCNGAVLSRDNQFIANDRAYFVLQVTSPGVTITLAPLTAANVWISKGSGSNVQVLAADFQVAAGPNCSLANIQCFSILLDLSGTLSTIPPDFDSSNVYTVTVQATLSFSKREIEYDDSEITLTTSKKLIISSKDLNHQPKYTINKAALIIALPTTVSAVIIVGLSVIVLVLVKKLKTSYGLLRSREEPEL